MFRCGPSGACVPLMDAERLLQRKTKGGCLPSRRRSRCRFERCARSHVRLPFRRRCVHLKTRRFVSPTTSWCVWSIWIEVGAQVGVGLRPPALCPGVSELCCSCWRAGQLWKLLISPESHTAAMPQTLRLPSASHRLTMTLVPQVYF